MKHQLLIKRITQAGAILVRHGSRHDIYTNPKTGAVDQVPRHADVKEALAKSIIRNLSAEK
jgi:predicted RNA binding protein YcfA (HicA-like mRNA interferase family)